MANTDQTKTERSETLSANPVVVVQEIGQVGRNFFVEIGSLFWFIVHTISETFERLRHGRVPFRASSFFATPSVPESIRSRWWGSFRFFSV